MATVLSTFDASHEECRHRVCIVCYGKGSRTLSETEIQTIQDFLIDGFDIENSNFPCAACVKCHIMLLKKHKDPDFLMPIRDIDYEPRRPTALRSIQQCTCRICNVARTGGLQYRKTMMKKRGRRPTKEASLREFFKVCGNCMAKIYRGSNHTAQSCKSSRRAKIDNIEEMVKSPISLERLASRTIKKSSDSTLSTLGSKKMRVENTDSNTKRVLFSKEDVIGMQQDLQLSNKGTKILSRDIRIVTGSRKSVESDIRKKLHDVYHQLDEFFELRQLVYRFEDKDSKLIKHHEQPTVVCTDLPGLISKIIETRQIEENKSLIKISIDGGGGFLKVCLSIFDIDNPYQNTSSSSMSKRVKDSGVKRVFVIGIVPKVSEYYVNVKRLWISIGIQALQKKYTVATDLKLCNIILGMMSHSSCHPCAWCDVAKENLCKKGKQRTISNLMDLFWNWFESRRDKKDAKNYGNVIHPPILSDDDSNNTPVISILPPPELHLLMGPVNKLYNELENVWPESKLWLKQCNVKKEAYHGGQFAGNESRKLLNNVDKLEALSPPIQCERFIIAFKSFNEVVSSCYGEDLKADYLRKIKIFSNDYMKLNISVTPKIHAVMYHIAEFCQMTGRGLGPWSEQAGESVHHDFNETWKRFQVNDIKHHLYGEQLLKAVCMYNGQHL